MPVVADMVICDAYFYQSQTKTEWAWHRMSEFTFFFLR